MMKSGLSGNDRERARQRALRKLSVRERTEKEILDKSFQKLSPREKRIMELRFGLYGNEEKTQKEIADMLGISQSYISRLEKKIVSRLKKDISKLV